MGLTNEERYNGIIVRRGHLVRTIKKSNIRKMDIVLCTSKHVIHEYFDNENTLKYISDKFGFSTYIAYKIINAYNVGREYVPKKMKSDNYCVHNHSINMNCNPNIGHIKPNGYCEICGKEVKL